MSFDTKVALLWATIAIPLVLWALLEILLFRDERELRANNQDMLWHGLIATAVTFSAALAVDIVRLQLNVHFLWFRELNSPGPIVLRLMTATVYWAVVLGGYSRQRKLARRKQWQRQATSRSRHRS